MQSINEYVIPDITLWTMNKSRAVRFVYFLWDQPLDIRFEEINPRTNIIVWNLATIRDPTTRGKQNSPKNVWQNYIIHWRRYLFCIIVFLLYSNGIFALLIHNTYCTALKGKWTFKNKTKEQLKHIVLGSNWIAPA